LIRRSKRDSRSSCGAVFSGFVPAGPPSTEISDDPPVVAGDAGVVVAELLEQARRAFDVGEDECDGAAGQRGHRAKGLEIDIKPLSY
jgi:hypothetical protein